MRVWCAVKALIEDKNRYLIIRQEVKDKLFWDLPGGRVEHGESPYDTLLREVKEETKLDIKIIKPVGIWWFFRLKDNDQVVCNTFLCKPKHLDVGINSNPADENIKEFRWLTKEEILDLDIYPSLKELIKSIKKKNKSKN